jgi:hypothetical protein
MTWYKFQSFVHTSPHLSKHIRSLAITYCPAQDVKKPPQSPFSHKPYWLEFYVLVPMVAELPQLRFLTLNHVELIELYKFDLQKVQCNVEHISFCPRSQEPGCSLASVDLAPLFSLLMSFTAVRTLDFKYVAFFRGLKGLPSDYIPFYPHLEVLKLNDSDFLQDALLDLVQAAACGRLPALKRLEVGYLIPEDIEELGKLLLQLAPRLSSLSLQYSFTNMHPAAR